MDMMRSRLRLLLLLAAPLAGCGVSPSSIGDAALYDLQPPPRDLLFTPPDARPCINDFDCPIVGGRPLQCRNNVCVP